MTIALLHNTRPAGADPDDDEYEEYDSPETIEAITAALAPFGEVVPIEAGRNLPACLQSRRYEIAFNIAEGSGGRCREAHAAAVCELLRIPVTHSDSLTLALTLDKALARRAVCPDIPVAPAVLSLPGEPLRLDNLTFPVVVKPNHEGSSKGIRDTSLASTPEEVYALAQEIHRRYKGPALVEQYLPGAEVTAGVVGNGPAARVLGLMEISPAEPGAHFLYSLEMKRAFRERVRYTTPPVLPAATLRRIEADALTAYRILGSRDIARIDFRLDACGIPHFLECNPLPGLNAESGDIVILSRGHTSYNDLVAGILMSALKRYGLS